jgi:hypothetical protein
MAWWVASWTRNYPELLARSWKAQYAGGSSNHYKKSGDVYFTLGEIIAVFMFGALCLHFLGAIRVRELALQAVGQASRRDDFQLLDQSVHIRRLSLSRDGNGRWRIWRQYRFDYTFDGVERRQGFVIMLGKHLQAVVVSEPSTTLH